MDKNSIDASLGLEFSLSLFERYRKNGLLQAEIHHVPGIHGHCKGTIQLVEGKVQSCYVEDKRMQRLPISKNTLVRIDNERGPFEWSLSPLPAPPSEAPMTSKTQSVNQKSGIPTVKGRLDVEKLEGWSMQQKMMLSLVYGAINGQRDIDAIKQEVPLPSLVTEDALRVLLALEVIIII